MEKSIIKVDFDKKGNKVVVINKIIFYGKRYLPWNEVEKNLKKYIGKVVNVAETGEEINIGPEFPNEYKGSQDTITSRGPNAKANAVQQTIINCIYVYMEN